MERKAGRKCCHILHSRIFFLDRLELIFASLTGGVVKTTKLRGKGKRRYANFGIDVLRRSRGGGKMAAR